MDKKLPESVKGLRDLFRKKFEVKKIYESVCISVKGEQKNKVIKESVLFKCPHCGNEFKGKRFRPKREIYGSTIATDPNICPFCDFPKSVLCALLKAGS